MPILPHRGAQPGNHNARRHGLSRRHHSTRSGNRADTAQAAKPTGGGATSPASPVPPVPTLADILNDFAKQNKDLKAYLFTLPTPDKSDPDAVKAFAAASNLYSNNLARMARIIKYLQPLGGDKADKLYHSLNEALDLLSEEFGVTF